MPNNRIDPSLAQALNSAFGGSQPSSVPQPSAPVAPPSGGSAAGPSLWEALKNAINGPVDPYQNFANKATGKDYK